LLTISIIIVVYYELLYTMSTEQATNDPFWHLPACHLYLNVISGDVLMYQTSGMLTKPMG